jgi:hydroxyethylthiazole kinase-like uncharacterized protein yjeF
MRIYNADELKKLYSPPSDSSGEQNGQVTIVGGSKLFHGAPILSLKVASKMVDMVFFASPEPGVGKVVERIKSKLMSFIWIPWEDIEAYIEKSDAILIGPGFMRFGSEKTPEEQRGHENHTEGQVTREITKNLLKKFPKKRWVIDGGSLQTMDEKWIPKNAILTPNTKEFEMLFKVKIKKLNIKTTDQNTKIVGKAAKKHGCTIVLKGPETIVCSPDESVVVKGGNAGLTKGGTGDILAGLAVSLYAKNDALLSAASASFIEKFTADEIYKERGIYYNADDLAERIPRYLHDLTAI